MKGEKETNKRKCQKRQQKDKNRKWNLCEVC